MEVAIELFYDDEADAWGYTVPALNIIGTGCLTREDALRYAEEAIGFVLEGGEEKLSPEGEIVRFRVELTPSG